MCYAVLMGRTGCGKTTLVEIICGLRRPVSGRVRLGDRDVTQELPAVRGVGYVPQDGAMFPTMTVREQLGFALQVRRRTPAEIAARVDQLATELSITALLDRLPQALSGGERQRVALGRALAAQPKVLVLDEPLSALDEELRDDLAALLRRVQREHGITALHITHSRAEAEQVADVLFRLADGRLTEIPVDRRLIRAKPRHQTSNIGHAQGFTCRRNAPRMNRRLLFLACTLVTVAASLAASPSAKPNIVFILADDLGWSDTTLYGTTKFYETPNVARLAARGLTFTNAYAAAPVCSPTRASIMTGLYPGRIGFTAPSGHVPEEMLEATLIARGSPAQKSMMVKSVTRLKLEYFTLAEALKGARYATGHFGKWHLGPEPFDPLQQGFDVDIPHWSGPGPSSYLAPWKSPKFNLAAKRGTCRGLDGAGSHQVHPRAQGPSVLSQLLGLLRPFALGREAGLIEKYRAKADQFGATQRGLWQDGAETSMRPWAG